MRKMLPRIRAMQGLAAFFCVSVLALPASGQEAPAAQADSVAAAPQYKFNLAPGQSAPGAKAEVLLTAKEAGGYSAEITASALPEPATLKPGSSTYVVWVYDPTTKKKERLGALPVTSGAGTGAFDIGWGKFALVVTVEPSAEPTEWSGIAVLTGQPALPETVAAAAGPPSYAGANEGAAAPPAGAEAEQAAAAGAPVAGAEPAGPAAGADAAGQPGAPEAGAPGVDASAGAAAATDTAAAGVAAATDTAAADAAAGVAAEPGAAGADPSAGVALETEAGAEAGVGVAVEEDAGEGAEGEETEEGRKKRFRNSALDRLAAEARGAGEEAEAVEEEEEAEPENALDAMHEAARGEAPVATVKLEGTSKSPDASGKVQIDADGTLRLNAKNLPNPTDLGADMNAFVLWTVDPGTGKSQKLGVLESGGGGAWTLIAPGGENVRAFVVTVEPGPQSTTRSGPAVLSGRIE